MLGRNAPWVQALIVRADRFGFDVFDTVCTGAERIVDVIAPRTAERLRSEGRADAGERVAGTASVLLLIAASGVALAWARRRAEQA